MVGYFLRQDVIKQLHQQFRKLTCRKLMWIMKKTRSIFRTHSNIYDGVFFCNNSKLLTVFAKILHQRLLNWILDMLQHKAYIEFSWMSMIKLFRNNIYQLKVINYFCRTTPSFDWVSQGLVSLGNCQKKMDMKRHFPNHIKYFIALFLSHIYFVKQIPPPPPLFCKGPNIYDIQKRSWWRDFEIYHKFTDSVVFKLWIDHSFLQMGIGLFMWEL